MAVGMAVGAGVGGDAQEERMTERRSRVVRKHLSVDKASIQIKKCVGRQVTVTLKVTVTSFG